MVHLALTHFIPFLSHSHVIVRKDNMAVVSHINCQGGSRSRTLNRHARQLLLWAQDKFLSLRAVHVPGVLNLTANFLSRQKLRCRGMDSEPPYGGSDLGKIRRGRGGPLCVAGVEPMPPLILPLSPTSLGIDALAHPWPDMKLYAFPPVKLIPAVLRRVKTCGLRLLLVAPFWPSQTWFSELISLLEGDPILGLSLIEGTRTMSPWDVTCGHHLVSSFLRGTKRLFVLLVSLLGTFLWS